MSILSVYSWRCPSFTRSPSAWRRGVSHERLFSFFFFVLDLGNWDMNWPFYETNELWRTHHISLGETEDFGSAAHRRGLSLVLRIGLSQYLYGLWDMGYGCLFGISGLGFVSVVFYAALGGDLY